VEAWPESLKVAAYQDMLPLHCACFSPTASTDVIRYLVDAYPEAVHSYDDRHRLPLHLVCAQDTMAAIPLETIECLVQAWPDSVRMRHKHVDIVWCQDGFTGDDIDSESGDRESDAVPGLALDLACAAAAEGGRPSPEMIRVLTSDMPPLHFACTYLWTTWTPVRMATLAYLAPLFPNDPMHFHHDMLPLHCACLVGAPRSVLEWLVKQYPEAIRMATTDVGNLPLHCYLSSTTMVNRRISMDYSAEPPSHLSAVEYLLEQYPDAVYRPNRMGWLPLHVAAMHNAPLDVLFRLTRRVPEIFLATSSSTY